MPIKFILLLIFFCLTTGASADDLILKRDRWKPDTKLNVIDPETNKRTGEYLKKDVWDADKWNIYDKDGKKKGTIERDRWNKDQFKIKKEKEY